VNCRVPETVTLLGWDVHVACKKYRVKILVENLKERAYFGDLKVDGKIILKWIVNIL
jgi:hypothetical protein